MLVRGKKFLATLFIVSLFIFPFAKTSEAFWWMFHLEEKGPVDHVADFAAEAVVECPIETTMTVGNGVATGVSAYMGDVPGALESGLATVESAIELKECMSANDTPQSTETK